MIGSTSEGGRGSLRSYMLPTWVDVLLSGMQEVAQRSGVDSGGPTKVTVGADEGEFCVMIAGKQKFPDQLSWAVFFPLSGHAQLACKTSLHVKHASMVTYSKSGRLRCQNVYNSHFCIRGFEIDKYFCVANPGECGARAR